MLKFKEAGLLSIDFFVQGLDKPVAIASYSVDEQNALATIKDITPFNSNNIARWCRQNRRKFQII